MAKQWFIFYTDFDGGNLMVVDDTPEGTDEAKAAYVRLHGEHTTNHNGTSLPTLIYGEIVEVKIKEVATVVEFCK